MNPRTLLLVSLLLLVFVGASIGQAEGQPLNDHEHHLVETLDLCGDTCADVVRRGGLANCALTFGQGCPRDTPPDGFTKTSTLWNMCPLSCPAAAERSASELGHVEAEEPKKSTVKGTLRAEVMWCAQAENHVVIVSREERSMGTMAPTTLLNALNVARRCGFVKLRRALSSRLLKQLFKAIGNFLESGFHAYPTHSS